MSINPNHPLARLLEKYPRMAQALEGSLARQQEVRQAKAEQGPGLRVVASDCPHCGAEGVKYMTLGKGAQARDYYRRREDCCQPAILDAALGALHYGMNPHGVIEEQVEAERNYKRLRALITEPALKAELAEHERYLAGIAERITDLTRAQGGVDWGRQ